jgi:2-desacetyl-2-hydroxyethyl bacteriochlorophyllide A dehydrogenase
MRAMVYVAPRDLRLQELEDPELGPDDVLVRIEACGICGSDVASYELGHYAKPGQVLGHELSSVVVRAGSGLRDIAPGQRVAVRTSRSCGHCPYCTSGRPYLCGESGRFSIGYGARGGFADLMVVRGVTVGEDLLPVPDDLAADDLVWVEPLSVAVHAVRRARLTPTSGPALVVGAGSVGLCVIAAAAAAGIGDLTVVEPREDRRSAAERLGARALSPADLAEGAETYTGVVDTSGVAAALTVPLRRLRTGGTLTLVGLGDDPVPWPLPGIDLVTSFAWDEQDFAAAVAHIVQGRVRLSGFISHRFTLDETGAAISASAHDPHVIKAVVYPGAPSQDAAHP